MSTDLGRRRREKGVECGELLDQVGKEPGFQADPVVVAAVAGDVVDEFNEVGVEEPTSPDLLLEISALRDRTPQLAEDFRTGGDLDLVEESVGCARPCIEGGAVDGSRRRGGGDGLPLLGHRLGGTTCARGSGWSIVTGPSPSDRLDERPHCTGNRDFSMKDFMVRNDRLQ